MPSNKAIAQHILTGTDYGNDQRADMAQYLQQATQMGRADERRRILKSLSEQHDMIAQKRREVSREDRKERFKLSQSMRTIDAMMTLLGGGKDGMG